MTCQLFFYVSFENPYFFLFIMRWCAVTALKCRSRFWQNKYINKAHIKSVYLSVMPAKGLLLRMKMSLDWKWINSPTEHILEHIKKKPIFPSKEKKSPNQLPCLPVNHSWSNFGVSCMWVDGSPGELGELKLEISCLTYRTGWGW